MKKILRFTLAALLLGILSLAIFLGIKEYQQRRERAAYLASLRPSAAPNVQTLPDTVLIDYLGEKRTLYVYLPPDYRDNDTTRYPVLYFFDGESLFDEMILEGEEWQVDELINQSAANNGPTAIVIGVADGKDRRLTEYKPFPSPDYPDEEAVSGAAHMEWAATDLKQWVDQHYRTLPDREHTTIGGCSLSGLMAYYGIMKYPEVYGGAFVFSPSFWVNDTVFTLHKKVNLRDIRIYFGSGEEEVSIVDDAQRAHDLLLRAGMPKENLRFDVFGKLGHEHATWRKSFARAYPWALGYDDLSFVAPDSLHLIRKGK